MERVKRNTKGLRQNAQKKREETFEKFESAIRQLMKEKRRINFNTVVEVSGISKAWLYKEPEIRTRIEQLRKQGNGGKQAPVKRQISDPSKDALLKTFKERIKKLEAENQDLRRQNEMASSYMLRVRQLEQQIRRLEAENERLRQQEKQQLQSHALSDREKALKELGVTLNSTLVRLMQETPDGIIDTAINSLKEAIERGRVENPGGFLNRAIQDAWQPNGAYQEKADMEEFNEWWKWAYKEGLVKAATQFDGVQYVLTANEDWVPFEQIKNLTVPICQR